MTGMFRAAATRPACILVLALIFGRTLSAYAQPGSASVGPGLGAMIAEAMIHNPDVIAARTRWQALTRVPIQARTLPDPQVQFQEFTVGSPRPGAGYETSNFYYTGIGASQEIPGPGKLRLRGEIAEQDAEVARHQYEAAQRSAAEKVRENYFELFYLARTAAMLEAERGDLEQIQNIAQARYRVGEGPAQDVIKSQLQATQMLNAIEHHHREMQQRQIDLKTVLGRDPDSPDITIGDLKPTPVHLTPAELASAVRTHSPEVTTDRAMERRSEKALALARRGYLPDFNVGYAYDKTGPGFRDYYMLTLGAKIPLYFWRKQTPAIDQAGLELAAARSQTRAGELDMGASAADQLVAIHASDRVLNIYRAGLIPQAETSMQAALAAYRVSKLDFQTLISAFVDLLNLREEYYRELADREIAVAKLEQIAGDLK